MRRRPWRRSRIYRATKPFKPRLKSDSVTAAVPRSIAPATSVGLMPSASSSLIHRQIGRFAACRVPQQIRQFLKLSLAIHTLKKGFLEFLLRALFDRRVVQVVA